MTRLITLIAALLLGSVGAQAKSLTNTNWRGIALDGYDAVAFHTEGATIKGSSDYTTTYEGAKYRFSSAKNQKRFEANPNKYVPAYGGYCAWAVSVKNDTAPVDIDTWQIIDGRLILNYNAAIQAEFDADQANHIRQADKNWPDLLERKGK